jgi:hypothetical protein
VRPCLKKKNKNWGIARVVECLPRKLKALSLIPTTSKEEEGGGEEGGEKKEKNEKNSCYHCGIKK